MSIHRGALAALTLAALTFGALSTASADPQEFDAGMQPVVEAYLKIQAALAADSTEGVAEAAKALGEAAGKLDAKSVTGEHAAHYADLPAKIAAGAKAVAEGEDLGAVRESFKELSQPVVMWATMSKPDHLFVIFCPMAKGSWLQRDKDVRNPYHGKSMLTCGEVVSGPGVEKKGEAMPMKHPGGHEMHGH